MKEAMSLTPKVERASEPFNNWTKHIYSIREKFIDVLLRGLGCLIGRHPVITQCS